MYTFTPQEKGLPRFMVLMFLLEFGLQTSALDAILSERCPTCKFSEGNDSLLDDSRVMFKRFIGKPVDFQ